MQSSLNTSRRKLTTVVSDFQVRILLTFRKIVHLIEFPISSEVHSLNTTKHIIQKKQYIAQKIVEVHLMFQFQSEQNIVKFPIRNSRYQV